MWANRDNRTVLLTWGTGHVLLMSLIFPLLVMVLAVVLFTSDLFLFDPLFGSLLLFVGLLTIISAKLLAGIAWEFNRRLILRGILQHSPEKVKEYDTSYYYFYLTTLWFAGVGAIAMSIWILAVHW